MFIHLSHTLCVALSLLISGSGLAMAESSKTPEGLWTTYTSDDQKPATLVRITGTKGKLNARIEKILIPEDIDRRCTTCAGANKDRRLQGLEILWNLEPVETGVWGNGEILDPDNGRIYSAKIALLEGGKKLEVRGYLGITLIGRSQFWHRTN